MSMQFYITLIYKYDKILYNASMRVVSLASSSKGNCTYIETPSSKILIDIGIRLPALELALGKLGVDPSEIDAVVISHEHDDHIKGVPCFVKKYKLPIYAYAKTVEFLNAKLKLDEQFIRTFTQDLEIGDMHILPVEVPHDSHSCYGFVVNCDKSTMAIVTDCGAMNERIIQALSGVPLVYLESNYDEELLMQCKYPYSIKMRIKSNHGHLSNIDCAKTIERLVMTGTRQIVLSHISENSNSPLIAYSTSKSYLMSRGIVEGVHVKIDVAKTVGPSTVFKL